MKNKWYGKSYIQIMEQVKYPDGVKSHHPVVCTEEQAKAKIGTLYPENPSWRIIEMRPNP